jgi:hypothetical protein
MLTAVQSLRRAGSEGWRPYRTLDYVINVDLGRLPQAGIGCPFGTSG